MEISKQEVSLWDYTEIILESDFAGNPFKDIQLNAQFKHDNTVININGFYDGDKQWKIRFMPVCTGKWEFNTSSPLDALSGHKGTIMCTEAENGVHGIVQVADTTHFAYSDGTAYYPVGTTCYVWNHQGEELEQKTLRTLKKSPFNKLRFCVYPKRYTFNHNEPQCYPFPGEVTEKWNPADQDDYSPKKRDYWDFDFFCPEYFQHLDECVLQLMDLGIEADLILFHPYDFGAWGFDCIPEDVNNRILEYLVARLGAFRNIWWSFANEYDLFQNKSIHEWYRYIRLVQETDPYHHLRSIHNCRGFYDHSKPGITHCSVQSNRFDKIPEWFNKYSKPVVIDECGYEGNINRDWGNISPKEMVRRLWSGFSSGAYVGHGETYLDPGDVLWWSKGGELHGDSPARIAFLRKIIEEFPTRGLTVFEEGESFMPRSGAASGYGVYPEFGLYYFGIHRPSFRFLDLPEEGIWEVDVIDTWEMTVTSAGKEFSGHCRVDLPGKEWIAIRIRKVK